MRVTIFSLVINQTIMENKDGGLELSEVDGCLRELEDCLKRVQKSPNISDEEKKEASKVIEELIEWGRAVLIQKAEEDALLHPFGIKS